MELMDQLPIRLRLLAAVMRAMPKGVRKFAWWWERLYQHIGGGGFEDNEAIDSLWPPGEVGPIRNSRFGYKTFLDLRVFAEPDLLQRCLCSAGPGISVPVALEAGRPISRHRSKHWNDYNDGKRADWPYGKRLGIRA